MEEPVTTPAPGPAPSPSAPAEAPSSPPAEPEPESEPPSSGNPGSSASAPLSAQGEDFAEQPAAVLLTYSETVTPSVAAQCVGLSASGSTATFGGIEQGPTAQTIRLELVPGGAMPAKVRCPAEADVKPASSGVMAAHSTTGVDVLPVAPAVASPGGVVSDPIDPKYLTEVPFGASSFWIQPWRAYLDTWPASRLLSSLGINFNVTPAEASDVAQLLQDSGFKLARIEISWNMLSYENPTKFVNEHSIRQRLLALHEHGLRPLILLNSNSGGPTPNEPVTLDTISEAPAGSTTVSLSLASASRVVPGKTGFNKLGFGGMADVLIKKVDSQGVATLSRPLAQALPAGEHAGATLLYAPFGPPTLSNGQPNPQFQATLQGWLSYVSVVAKYAASIFGPGGYDLEIWNELSFGSQFLNEERYYSPAREEGSGKVPEAVLDDTVSYLRDPNNGISREVGITDGFASQTPFPSGATVPAGTTALSKHYYAGLREFPKDDEINNIQPIDAQGDRDFELVNGQAHGPFQPLFVPTYDSFFPEYMLTATQTESIIRDLSPITTYFYSTAAHGRNVGRPGEPHPEIWMTEYNLPAAEAQPVEPNETTPAPVKPTSADERHLQTKALLRHLVSMVSKGLGRDYFFAAAHAGNLDVIESSFITDLSKHSTEYPGDEAGGETTTAFRRMLAQFQESGPLAAPRQLQLLSIAQEGEHAQFAGDGTAAHPPLYDREALGVFPFQASPTRFVIPIYVMTRNLATLYEPSAPSTDIERYDLPSENFRITLGNLPETSNAPNVSAYDPIRNEATRARLISRQGSSAVFEFAALDYPRLLTIDYAGK